MTSYIKYICTSTCGNSKHMRVNWTVIYHLHAYWYVWGSKYFSVAIPFQFQNKNPPNHPQNNIHIDLRLINNLHSVCNGNEAFNIRATYLSISTWLFSSSFFWSSTSLILSISEIKKRKFYLIFVSKKKKKQSRGFFLILFSFR